MRKYEKGERITSLDVMMEQEFVYWCGKVYHQGWFHGWQIGWVKARMQYGGIYKAVKKEDKGKWIIKESRNG